MKKMPGKMIMLSLALAGLLMSSACGLSAASEGVSAAGQTDGGGTAETAAEETGREILFGAEDLTSEESGTEGKQEVLQQVSEEESGTELPQAGENADFIVMSDPALYSYGDMEEDIRLLCARYPGLVTCDSLGTTDDGRELYRLIVGDPAAEHRLQINASIHGREYITTQLVMKQCVEFVQHLAAGDSYQGTLYSSLTADSCIHFVPMVNPDGVTISQFGLEGLNSEASRDRVRGIAALDGADPSGEYLRRWKSNVNGIDLNRNFDGFWEEYEDPVGRPSSDHYKGTSPLCETESRAMAALEEQEQFDYILNYHAQGNLLYWFYNEEGEALQIVTRFKDTLQRVTGYVPDDGTVSSVDTAGYRDWTEGTLGVPSITVEVGWDYAPVDPAQFPEIWQCNRCVPEEVCLLMMS